MKFATGNPHLTKTAREFHAPVGSFFYSGGVDPCTRQSFGQSIVVNVPKPRGVGGHMAPSMIKVHRFQASLFPVNAYLVETPSSVIAIDATLGVSDGRALGARAEALGKPLAGVVVTHSHPDHYGGIGALLGGRPVPVYGVEGVDRIIRRDDPAKEQILRPMFGREWATTRRFPDRIVGAVDRVTIGDATFRVMDVGPCESPHDSWWIVEGDRGPYAFVGDLVISHMHAYLADGFYDEWLTNLERAKRELPPDAVLFMGHGEPLSDHAILDWQAEYIHRFLASLRSAVERGLDGDALADAVTNEMTTFVGNEDLLFLLRLSVAPIRERLQAVGR
jgi:glyoxylase-like metal-dependent hydrolase (beta-lactamase superfamily II)